METRYVECECQTIEHLLRFVWDPEWEEMYIDVFLDHSMGFFKRLWYGVKYIFGYKTSIGNRHFECVILKKDKIKQLKIICEEALGGQWKSFF